MHFILSDNYNYNFDVKVKRCRLMGFIKAINDVEIFNQEDRPVGGLTNTVQRPCENEWIKKKEKNTDVVLATEPLLVKSDIERETRALMPKYQSLS